MKKSKTYRACFVPLKKKQAQMSERWIEEFDYDKDTSRHSQARERESELNVNRTDGKVIRTIWINDKREG